MNMSNPMMTAITIMTIIAAPVKLKKHLIIRIFFAMTVIVLTPQTNT